MPHKNKKERERERKYSSFVVYIISAGGSVFVTTWTPSTGKPFSCTLIRYPRKKFYCERKKSFLNPLVALQVFIHSFLLKCLLLVWRGMR